VLGLLAFTPGTVPAAAAKPVGQADSGLSAADRASLAAGLPVAPKAPLGARPKGPNPLLAMVPDAAKVDYSGWRNYLGKQASAKTAARLKALAAASPAYRAQAATPPVAIDENEPDGLPGSNESPATAQLIDGSDQDATFIYPMASPLPGGGTAATDYVATKSGWHYVGVRSGTGAYDITVEAYRPALQGAKPAQTLFLDFDGERVNTGVFGGTGNVELSPFSAFVARWGLTNADRDALIDAVVAAVTENLKKDMVASGLNKKFRLKVLNSKDDPDPWGEANVSRIVVGGTIAESGVSTIGIAQSIDPGNFETEETALVLLDEVSQAAGPEDSFNTYLAPQSDKIAFIGHALGNVVAHEGGHFFGNWHTDNGDATPNLMDSGGENFGVLFGVGPDGIGGTADDVDVDFGDDAFSPAEDFLGTEDTLGRVAFGVTS